MDMVQMYERQIEKTAGWVQNVTPDQLDGPTTCPEWDVRTLLNHMIGGNFMFATIVPGGPMPSEEPPDFAGQDAIGHYQQSAKAALEAFRAPGALEASVTGPIGTHPGAVYVGAALTDAAVHGWDLARSTGQDATIDDDIATALFEGNQMIPQEARRPPISAFADPVPVGDDASPTDRLVAWLGRQP